MYVRFFKVCSDAGESRNFFREKGYYIVQLAPTLGGLWQMLMGTALVPLENVWPTILTYSLASGALVGGLGSMFSIRKHLNV